MPTIAHILSGTNPNGLRQIQGKLVRVALDISRYSIDSRRLGIAGVHGNGGMNKDEVRTPSEAVVGN